METEESSVAKKNVDQHLKINNAEIYESSKNAKKKTKTKKNCKRRRGEKKISEKQMKHICEK